MCLTTSCLLTNARDIIRKEVLYATDVWSGSVYEYTSSGVQKTFTSGLYYPRALAFDAKGDLFVGDNHGTIYRFFEHGRKNPFVTGLNFITGMAFDQSDNLFVLAADNNPGGCVFKFDKTGKKTVVLSGLMGGTGLAFDSHGNLFVADVGLYSCIYKITPAGQVTSFVPYMENYIGNLAINNDDVLFASGVYDGNIYEFASDGSVGLFKSNLYYPFGITFDMNGNLFVAFVDGIYKITPDGKTTVFGPGSQVSMLAFGIKHDLRF
jgi:sugar lactone lactonase YvrE